MDFQGVNLPTVIWSGVIAGLITLGGVIFSNLTSIWIQHRQFKNDRTARQDERIFAARERCYVEYIQHANDAAARLGLVADETFDTQEYSNAISNVLSSLQKIQIVGSSGTAAIASRLIRETTDLSLQSQLKSLPVRSSRLDRSLALEEFNSEIQLGKQIVEEIKLRTLNNNLDRRTDMLLNSRYREHESNWVRANEERKGFDQRVIQSLNEFNEYVLLESLRLAPLQIEMFSSIRTELGLTPELAERLAEFEIHRLEIVKIIQRLSVEARQLVEE